MTIFKCSDCHKEPCYLFFDGYPHCAPLHCAIGDKKANWIKVEKKLVQCVMTIIDDNMAVKDYLEEAGFKVVE